MKERFANRLLKGKIHIKLKQQDGSIKTWTADKGAMVKAIQEITADYASQNYRITLRQLHYQLVGVNAIVNHQTAYKKLGTILDDCRYAGAVDWDNITDRGRQLKYPHYEDGIPEALHDMVYNYRLERQKGQVNHVEVWTEKDALTEIFWRSVAKYGVGLCVNKGYTSSSAIYSAYERFSETLNEGREVTILYFGDHDPSGLDMIRDIRERLTLMFTKGERLEDRDLVDNFKVIPIGLNMKQIKQYKLPPNPAKMTDSRSGAYVKKFGKMCWEVDALKANVLSKIIDDNIEKQIDMELVEDIKAQEVKDIAELNKFIKKHKKK